MSRIFSAIIGSHDDKHGTNDNRKTKLNENKISKNIIIYDYSPVISFCFLFIIPVDEKDLSIFLLHPRVISSGFLALFFFFYSSSTRHFDERWSRLIRRRMNDRILALESFKWDPLGKPSSFLLAPPVNLIRLESKEGIDVQYIHSRVCHNYTPRTDIYIQ